MRNATEFLGEFLVKNDKAVTVAALVTDPYCSFLYARGNHSEDMLLLSFSLSLSLRIDFKHEINPCPTSGLHTFPLAINLRETTIPMHFAVHHKVKKSGVNMLLNALQNT